MKLRVHELDAEGCLVSGRRVGEAGVDSLQGFFQVPVPGQVHALQVFLQLRQAGGADDVAGHERARGDELQRQVRGADAALFSQAAVGLGSFSGLVVGVAAELFDQGQPGVGGPLVVAVFAGQHAERQG